MIWKGFLLRVETMEHQRLIIALCCALLALPLPGRAQNVVVNPGFKVEVFNGLCLGIGGGPPTA